MQVLFVSVFLFISLFYFHSILLLLHSSHYVKVHSWVVTLLSCCNEDSPAALFAWCYPYVYFHTCILVCVCYVRIMGLLGQFVVWTSAGINRTPGVDKPVYSPFIWPCFAGLNEQASELMWDEVLMYSLLSCQPASLPVYLAAIGCSWAELSWLCWGLTAGWLPSLQGWGWHSAQRWPSLWFMSSFL